MQKHVYSLFAFLMVAEMALANVVTGVAAIPDNYYSGVDGKGTSESILDALFARIKDHNSINYKSLEPYYEQTDFYADTVWDMYSTCRFDYDDANKAQSEVCDGWNKEHSVPQSWFNEGSPMKSDLFHVYPTDARINNFRSNYPYGEVNGANGAGFSDNKGGHGLGKKGSNTFPGYTGTVFEPADEYKGDFARTYFYMVARYRDRSFTSSGGNAVFTSNKTNLTEFAKNLFLKWHRQDPVSQKEIDRNQAVYGIQHNRNPFIDYPELAEYIWGTKVGQTIDLSAMTPTCEGGVVTPPDPTPVTKYGLNWSVNGTVILTDSIRENYRPTAMPETPFSCSSESEVFMGWTDEPISSIADEAPAVLYQEVNAIPALTADITLYAVFAQAVITGPALPETYIYDADHKDGWTNTATLKNSSYWLLATGTSIVSPDVDLMTLESITVMMRTYGGTQYDQLDIYANDGKLTSITATKGKEMTEYTWTNNLCIAGISPLTFSSTYGSDKGIGIQSIVVHAAGTPTIYSRFITTCQTTTEIERVGTNIQARKLLINGQLYILMGDQLFNLQGQCVK